MLKHSSVENRTFHRQWLPQARETSVALGKVGNPIIFDSHPPVYSLASWTHHLPVKAYRGVLLGERVPGHLVSCVCCDAQQRAQA